MRNAATTMMQQQNPTLVYELLPFQAPDGTVWNVRVFGSERRDGTWIGWLEFTNALAGTRRTDRETTQSKFDDLSYWAKGLEPVYLEGALRRAN
jgi:hypothetical protein